jgi:hypothetical protein
MPGTVPAGPLGGQSRGIALGRTTDLVRSTMTDPQVRARKSGWKVSGTARARRREEVQNGTGKVIMRLLKGLLGVVLGIVTSVLGTVLGILAAVVWLLGAVLCVTILLLPLGLPVVRLARRLFGLSRQLMRLP